MAIITKLTPLWLFLSTAFHLISPAASLLGFLSSSLTTQFIHFVVPQSSVSLSRIQLSDGDLPIFLLWLLTLISCPTISTQINDFGLVSNQALDSSSSLFSQSVPNQYLSQIHLTFPTSFFPIWSSAWANLCFVDEKSGSHVLFLIFAYQFHLFNLYSVKTSENL